MINCVDCVSREDRLEEARYRVTCGVYSTAYCQWHYDLFHDTPYDQRLGAPGPWFTSVIGEIYQARIV